MATQVPSIEPTHVLVLGGLDDPERDALVSCHTAVLAALDHATSVDVYLDADHIAGVSLGSLADIGEAFDLVADGQYRGEIPEGAAHLAQLLDVRQFEEIAAVEGIVLRRADIPFLVYQPDDRLVELDASRTDSAVEDIRREVADYPVGLFEATPIVQWRADGREYALDPPTVTVDDAAFSLSNLASVTLDRERRRIHLAWNATQRGFLSRLTARFRPSRPTTLTFEDEPAFERIAQEFESVGETLGVLSGDAIDRF